MKPLTIRQFFQRFPSEEACLDHVMESRHGHRHTCRGCGKEASFYKLSGRRAYSCEYCGSHVYPCAGTMFERSRTPLQLWFYAIYLFSTSRHGVPAKELERQLGVTYKCAWRMGHEIRKHMAHVDGGSDDSGTGGKGAGDQGYMMHLKTGIAGTHKHVSDKHWDKYANEFACRHGFRKNPELMFPALLHLPPATQIQG